MEKLRVAVIGCGNISVMHLDHIASFSDVELVSVCDIKEDRAIAASKKYGGKVYTDYRELFKNERMDAVNICLPHYLHVPVAIKAFKNGISVLSEKPMSINYEDAEKAVRIADECGVKYGVISQCRYNAVKGEEEVEVSGKEALKTQNTVCQIYKNNDSNLCEKK